MVTGIIGQPVPVTRSTGTGLVTVHQFKWEAFTLGNGGTGSLLMIEVTFEATTGTVNTGDWFEGDSVGRVNNAQRHLMADSSLHELPDAGALAAGQKDRGWSAFFVNDPPVAPVEIYLIEVATTTVLAVWAIDGPPQALVDSMTAPIPFTPAPGPTLDCSTTLQGSNFGALADFHGQPSPIEAAQVFAIAGGVSGLQVPPDAVWTLGATDATGVFVATTGVLLHAIQSPTNQTWIIDQVQYCGA